MTSLLKVLAFIQLCQIGLSLQEFGILKFKNLNLEYTRAICVYVNNDHADIPVDQKRAPFWPFVNLSHRLLCNDDLDMMGIPDMTGSMVAVARGNCSFVEKALNIQGHGGRAMLVVSEHLVIPRVDNFTDILNISISSILWSEFDTIQGDDLYVQLYLARKQRFNILFLWLIASLTVALGGYLSGVVYDQSQKEMAKRPVSTTKSVQQSSVINQTRNNVAPDTGHSEGQHTEGHSVRSMAQAGHAQEVMDIPFFCIPVMVIIMTGLIVLLYFFFDVLVYAVIVVFMIYSATAIYHFVRPLFQRFPYGSQYRLPKFLCIKCQPEYRCLLLWLLCFTFPIIWFVYRKHENGWILQNLLAIIFSVHTLKTVLMPSFKMVFIFEWFLLIFDVAVVYGSRLFTPQGESLLVEIATGTAGTTGEKLPILLYLPDFGELGALCNTPGALLGLGDIIIPGFLVSYNHAYDMATHSKKVYYAAAMVGYVVGLAVAFIPVIVTEAGQPALLYLVPCTTGISLLTAFCRKELRNFWRGELYEEIKPAPDLIKDPEQTVVASQPAPMTEEELEQKRLLVH